MKFNDLNKLEVINVSTGNFNNIDYFRLICLASDEKSSLIVRVKCTKEVYEDYMYKLQEHIDIKNLIDFDIQDKKITMYYIGD